jgi:predicted KAP-like P-loop ATPase
MTISIGVIDEAVAPGETDNLDINIHSRSLISSIKQTNTPITVGIQGEWGSGKTSLINSIHHAFESDYSVKQIWMSSSFLSIQTFYRALWLRSVFDKFRPHINKIMLKR